MLHRHPRLGRHGRHGFLWSVDLIVKYGGGREEDGLVRLLEKHSGRKWDSMERDLLHREGRDYARAMRQPVVRRQLLESER